MPTTLSRVLATAFLRHLCRIPEEQLTRVKGALLSTGRFLLDLPPLAQRSHLPALLRLLRLQGIGVEVGVAEGAYSELLLRDSPLSKLYSIDPWKPFDRQLYNDRYNLSEQAHEALYRATAARLGKFGPRSQILRMTSQEAAPLFQPETLDVVYIDANHAYEACRRDLELWWPTLRPGGVFAGHDYLNGELPQGTFGVRRAVDEFVAAHGQRLLLTAERAWPTWYVIKDVAHLDPLLPVSRLLEGVRNRLP